MLAFFFFIQEVGVKPGEGHWAASSDAKQIILQHGEELDSSEGDISGFLSP